MAKNRFAPHDRVAPPSPIEYAHSRDRFLPEVNIEYAHSYADGESHEDHSKEEVLSQQRHCQWSRRDDLSQEQEEHSEWQKDRDAESDLREQLMILEMQRATWRSS